MLPRLLICDVVDYDGGVVQQESFLFIYSFMFSIFLSILYLFRNAQTLFNRFAVVLICLLCSREQSSKE
jgi:hypothetical protein